MTRTLDKFASSFQVVVQRQSALLFKVSRTVTIVTMTFNTFILVGCVLLVANGASLKSREQSQDGYEKIELTSPMRLLPILAIPYESTLKIIIPFKLPELLAGGKDIMASVFETVREEYKMTKVDNADKRFPVNSVLSRTSNYIVGTNQQIESYLNIFEDNNIPGFSVVTLNSSDWESLLEKSLQKMVDQILIEDNLKESFDAAPENTVIRVTSMLLTYIRGIAESCLHRHIPPSVLAAYLSEKLLNFVMDNNIFTPGYRPSFNLDQLEDILDETVTDCLLTQDRMYMIINIPLTSRQSKWQIYKADHSKFIYDRKLCSVGGVEDSPLYYAFDRNSENIMELTEDVLESTCQLKESSPNLCHIPLSKLADESPSRPTSSSSSTSTSPPPDPSLSCVTGIVNKLPLTELKDLCEFRCRLVKDSERFAEEVSQDNFFLTNVHKLKVMCPNSNMSRTFERVGALQVKIPQSDCYMLADDEFFPLTSTVQKEKTTGKTSAIEASYIFPSTWTKNAAFSIYADENINIRIKNFKEILDFDFLRKVAEEVTEEEVSEPRNNWSFGGGDDDDYVE